MTTLASLLASVFTYTMRPDQLARTQQAITNAIIKEHAELDYIEDLVLNSPISLTQTSPNLFRYSESLVTLGIYPQCRKILMIKEIPSNIYQDFGTFFGDYGTLVFNRTKASDIIDNYYAERRNYYSQIGQTINLVADREVDNIGILYYSTPVVDWTATIPYVDWIADEFPNLYIYAAAAEVFKVIGKDQEFKVMQQLVAETRMAVIKSKINEDT